MSHATTNASAAAAAEAAAYLINIPVGPDTWSDEKKLGALLEKVKEINKVFDGRIREIVLGLNQVEGGGRNPDDAKGKIEGAKVKCHIFTWDKPKDTNNKPLIRNGKEITVDYCAIRRGMMINQPNQEAYGNLKTKADRVYYVSIDPDTHITEKVLQDFEKKQTAEPALLTTGLYTFGKDLKNVVAKEEDYTLAKLILAIESEFGHQFKSKLAEIDLTPGKKIGDLLYPAEPIMFALIKDKDADIGADLLEGKRIAFPVQADHSEGQHLGLSLKRAWGNPPKEYLPENHLGFTYATEAPQRNIDSAQNEMEKNKQKDPNRYSLPRKLSKLKSDLGNFGKCSDLKGLIYASLKSQSQSAFSDNFQKHMISRIDFFTPDPSINRKKSKIPEPQEYRFTDEERKALKDALDSPAIETAIKKARDEILDAVIVRLKKLCKIR